MNLKKLSVIFSVIVLLFSTKVFAASEITTSNSGSNTLRYIVLGLFALLAFLVIVFGTYKYEKDRGKIVVKSK